MIVRHRPNAWARFVRAVRNRWDRAIGYVLGADLFFSYRRKDHAYVTALAHAVETRLAGVSCSIDLRYASADPRLPPEIRREIRRCRALVIVGTKEAVASSAVKREVRLFSRRLRPAVPINVGNVLNDEVWSRRPWSLIGGAQRFDEPPDAVTNNRPSDEIVEKLVQLASTTTQSRRLKRLAVETVALLVVAAIAALVIVSKTERRRRAADEKATAAENRRRQALRQEKKALDDAAAAIALAREAEGKRVDAVAKQTEAEGRRDKALLAAENAEARAAQARERARTDAIASQSLSSSGTTLHRRALRMAAEAHDRSPADVSYVTRAALFASLTRWPALRAIVTRPEAMRTDGSNDRTEGVSWARLFPDNRRVLTAMGTDEIDVVDLITGRVQPLERVDSEFGRTVALSPSGKFAAISDEGGAVIMDVRTGKQVGEPIDCSLAMLQMPSDDRLVAICMDANIGPDTIMAEGDLRLSRWNIETNALRPIGEDLPLDQFFNACEQVTLIPSDCRPGVGVEEVSEDADWIPYALTPDGNAIVLGADDGRIALVDVPASKVKRCFQRVDRNSNSALNTAAAVDPSTNTLAWADEGAVVVVDTESGEVRFSRCVEKGVGEITIAKGTIAFADGSMVVLVRRQSRTHWESNVALLRYASDIRSIELSRDARWLLTGSTDQAVALWSVDEMCEGSVPSLATRLSYEWFNAVEFTDDGRYLLAGDNDTTSWFDADSGKALAEAPQGMTKRRPTRNGPSYERERGVEISYTESSSGRAAAEGDSRGNVVVEGPISASFNVGGAVQEIAINYRGDLLAVISRYTATLWDVRSRMPLATLGPAFAVAFHPHRDLLAVGGEFGLALWPLEPRKWRDAALEVAASPPPTRVSPRFAHPPGTPSRGGSH